MLSQSQHVLWKQVANLVARWRLVQPLMSDFLATDLRPSDSYLVLAAHLLWDLWIATGSSKHFLRATTILQMGVTSSPSNWQMKLLLIRFYNRLVECSPSPNRILRISKSQRWMWGRLCPPTHSPRHQASNARFPWLASSQSPFCLGQFRLGG